MNCFHIKYLLRYIKEKEGKEFQIVRSKDYGINGILAFTVIIPSYFEVDKVSIIEDEYKGYVIEVKDNIGRNAITGSNILFWDSELESLDGEENSYILLEEVDNDMLIFDKFKNIPEYVNSEVFRTFLSNI